ncbi:MAG: hypothetical protein ACXW15_09200, partial [Acidimicrobiia bacterium]
MKRVLAILLVLVMITAACTDKAGEVSTTVPVGTTTSSTLPSTTATTEAPPAVSISSMIPGSPGAFAPFELIPLVGDGSAYPGPALPATLEGVLKPDSVTLDPEVAATLLAQGFVVVPDGYRQFQH